MLNRMSIRRIIYVTIYIQIVNILNVLFQVGHKWRFMIWLIKYSLQKSPLGNRSILNIKTNMLINILIVFPKTAML